MSASTVRTIDDVLSIMDSTLSRDASLSDSRKFIKNIARRDPHLMADSIDEIENIKSLLSPITQNPQVLVNVMAKTGAVVAGPQATSFFYPICDLTDAPWDIFCHSDSAEEFIRGYKQSSTAEVVEDVHADDGMRVVHMRKSIPAYPTPANIRIFVSNLRPFQSVLQLKNSYEQTVITAAGAVCFWPRLAARGMFRVFESNVGTSCYPRGKTFYRVELNPLKRTRLRKPMEKTEIYTGLESRVESVMFKNICDVDFEDYSLMADILENIVWAVSTSSTRYLGDIAYMK